MRILTFNDKDYELKFRPKDINYFEKLVKKPLGRVIGNIPTVEDTACLLMAGTDKQIKSIDEAFDMFEQFDGGYILLLEEINAEIEATGWLGTAQAQERNSKN